MKNIFKSGMSADLSAFDVAKKWSISPIEFISILEKGTNHELEHTDNKDIARRIALDHIVERLDYYDRLDKVDKMKTSAVLETPVKLNDIVLYHEKKGNLLFAKGNFYAWLYDESGVGKKLESGEYDFVMFPPMGKGNPFGDRYIPPLLMVWNKPYQKKFQGAEHLLSIVKGFYDEDTNEIFIDMMTTNPKYRRQGINTHIIKSLREEFGVSKENVIFDKPTKEGAKFMQSGKFAKGGDTNRNFNDKELLKRYNKGESIGFTAIAHLKAQGLIERSDGTKRKSIISFGQGGLIAPNGERSNLTPEQYNLVRTPEFKGWFGFWDLYPSGKTNNYYEPNVRTIARELKQEKSSAIKEVVDFLSNQVSEEDVLIPMPSRYGYATDTQKLAEKISEKTGAKVFDCLVGKKRQSIYELKKTNQNVSEFDFDFQINCEIPEARNYFIVDNVIGTGITMENALKNVIARVGKNVSPLVYAIDLNNISKVVDENDEPLVVHHGSIIETNFDIFDYKKADLGFHFGTKEQAKKRVESKSVLPPRKSIVNSFFLDIKVLFEMTDVGEWQYPQRYIDELMSDNIIEEKVAKQKGFLSLYRREDNAIIRDYLKSKYGSSVGFVYNNKYEGKGKSFIALSPNEIKLADGTNTTFDGNNSDIRFDNGGEAKKFYTRTWADGTIENFSVEDYEKNILPHLNNPNIRFEKGGKTISQTPAPASDRVSGSKTNTKGSASDSSLARSIKFNDSLLKAIQNKVKAHNEEYPSKKVTIPTAKAVVRRGMGAYSKSHRPFITGGAPNSRQAWGLARLNKFLLKKRGVKVKSAYVQDDDLL